VSVWVDPSSITAEEWPDAATMPPESLASFLDAAQDPALEYAPVLPEGADVPARYRLAVIYQARDIRRAALRSGDSEAIGDGAYPVRVAPMSLTVRSLLRPPSARPRFGYSTGS
jgi:hypothetical protein